MSSTTHDAAAGTMLAAALDYAANGWPVLPLNGKVPRIEGGLTRASTNASVVTEWWRRWPDASIGIRTGAESGLVVLDVDPLHGGLKSLEELKRKHRLPRGPQVLTGSGGQHLYFSYPEGGVRNSAGKLGDGLDVRGDGGYVVAPPSVHASGNLYKWLRELDRETLADPGSLFAHPNGNGKQPVAVAGAPIPSGSRNAELASLAGALRRRGGTEIELLAAIQAANERCEPPLPDDEVVAIAASIAGYQPNNVPADEHLEPFALDVTTAAAFCLQPDAASGEELLGPWVIRGYRVIVGGHTGEGKTTVALAIVRAVVTRGDLLGFTGSGTGRVLVLDAEQGVKSLKRRLREAGLDNRDDVDVIRVPDGLELDSDPRHVAELERVLAAGGYSIVVVDPLYKLHSGDSNAEREAVNLMRRFDGWRERFNFALLLPVHCRKPIPGMKFSIHDIFGSSAYVRGAEVVVGVQRLRDGYSKLHWLKDRDGDLPIGTSWGMLFSREDGYHRDPSDGKKETTADKMRELLAADPTLTNVQLEAALKVTERTIRRVRKELDQEHQDSLLEGGDDD